MYSHPGKKMLFMGGEFGQWREWNHDTSLDWHLCEEEPHRGLQRLICDLNRIYREEPALHEVDFDRNGFQWIDFSDADNSVIAFLHAHTARHGYRIGVLELGWYQELSNTDGIAYGGGNMGNGGGIHAAETPSHGFRYSLTITLSPPND